MKNSPTTKTIMFTDIVGYSTLVSNNETLAMSLLDEHNNLLMPLFKNIELNFCMIKKKFFILSSIILVGALGFEPRMVVPKTTALPLGYAPI